MWWKKIFVVVAGFECEILFPAHSAISQALIALCAGSTCNRRVGAAG
jgi:hypothetical protein